MAHTKAGGSTALGRDSQAKRLGVKMFEGQKAGPGMILVRQRGSKFRPGLNVRQGGDDTLYASAVGVIKFSHKKIRKYDGDLEMTTFVHVLMVPHEKKAGAAKAAVKAAPSAAHKASSGEKKPTVKKTASKK
ncbi:50S ribosomal protein L27 [Candidatus Uhrbacteria bacterium]|nr:50S ribosomal protein L27 [Candidatus Uhrbacteria bacterium]